MRRRGSTFGIPILLALITAVALVAALLGDGIFDVVAWLGLAMPLLIVATFLVPPGSRRG